MTIHTEVHWLTDTDEMITATQSEKRSYLTTIPTRKPTQPTRLVTNTGSPTNSLKKSSARENPHDRH